MDTLVNATFVDDMYTYSTASCKIECYLVYEVTEK